MFAAAWCWPYECATQIECVVIRPEPRQGRNPRPTCPFRLINLGNSYLHWRLEYTFFRRWREDAVGFNSKASGGKDPRNGERMYGLQSARFFRLGVSSFLFPRTAHSAGLLRRRNLTRGARRTGSSTQNATAVGCRQKDNKIKRHADDFRSENLRYCQRRYIRTRAHTYADEMAAATLPAA